VAVFPSFSAFLWGTGWDHFPVNLPHSESLFPGQPGLQQLAYVQSLTHSSINPFQGSCSPHRIPTVMPHHPRELLMPVTASASSKFGNPGSYCHRAVPCQKLVSLRSINCLCLTGGHVTF
jgi:hypothetical protein